MSHSISHPFPLYHDYCNPTTLRVFDDCSHHELCHRSRGSESTKESTRCPGRATRRCVFPSFSFSKLGNRFRLVSTGFRVSENLKTRKPGNVYYTTLRIHNPEVTRVFSVRFLRFPRFPSRTGVQKGFQKNGPAFPSVEVSKFFQFYSKWVFSGCSS